MLVVSSLYNTSRINFAALEMAAHVLLHSFCSQRALSSGVLHELLDGGLTGASFALGELLDFLLTN